MQKGDVPHLSVSFFVTNHDVLDLYVWSKIAGVCLFSINSFFPEILTVNYFVTAFQKRI